MYADITGAISPIEKEGFYLIVEPAKPAPWPGYKVVNDKLIWKTDHWEQTYKQQPLPSLTAAEWLMTQEMGYAQQPTLIYLRLQLTAKGLQSPKLDAVEEYLQGILKMFAEDPTPRNNWPLPTVTYQEAIQEATSLLEL